MSEAGFLADTHTILWWMNADPRLANRHRELIESDAPVFFSAVSMLEIGIKTALGKLRIPDDFGSLLRYYSITELPLSWQHSRRVATLPLHHRDPFDRALIAQTVVEGMTLMTSDETIRKYEVPVV